MLRPLTLRPLLLAVPAAALLLTGAATAQTTANPGTANPGTANPPPLMTAPRPDDQSTTDAVTSPPGVSGEAPSREVQNPAAPVNSPPANSPPVAALPPGAIDPQQARSLVGAELRTADGQPGGRIVDFTLTGDRIGNVVVAPNEVLGMGSKLVTVPVGALANGAEGLTLSMDQAELTKATPFAYGSEPTLTRANP
ncbi:PRC-barrel domain-containing protein [Azospirillum sp. TSO35-2]|uniref:PRC-barrel domain-containing protein n=1 Tax=Azospirillum sp. TSO35-2 TaxID=716796 RepID=UPI000D6127C6|nr:PRC-barrel domain-containing protein [Azospirillum sp. TSO35-2]PWC31147.1 hypothetical protein TSO352_30480 [Azospirillum sp. TSO35-2]